MKKGISLVALVITIVVLVILTGAVIITTIDSNIMGNTQTTVDMYNKKAIIEDIKTKIQAEKFDKINQGIYKLKMTDIMPIIQTYGDFDNTILKLTTTTKSKSIEIWLYEIMNIPLEEYATISYTNNILTVTTQLPSDLYRVQYTTNGGTSWELYNSPVTIAQESGIQIRLLNTEGRVVSNTLKLTNGYVEEIDDTAPSITIEPNGIGLAKETQVTITVTDDNELATNRYEYCLIQSQTSPVDNSSEWKPYTNGEAFTIGTGLTGTYYLHVKAVNDVVGNTSGNVVSQSYTFDNTQPYSFTPTVISKTTTSITIGGTTTDNNGQIVTYEYSINNGEDWQSSNTFTGLTAGTTYNQIQVKAKDTLGNVYITDSISVQLLGMALAQYVSVGDYISYNAGTWSTSPSAGNAKITESNGNFGMWSTNTDKGTSIPAYTYQGKDGVKTNTKSPYNGWRVLNVDSSTNTVSIISAGTVAAYYHGNGSSFANTTITNLNNWCSTNYGTGEFVKSARSINKTDLDVWYGSVIVGGEIIDNNLINVQSAYFMATASPKYTSGEVWMSEFENIGYGGYCYQFCLGVRPVIELKSNTIVTGGEGTVDSPYTIDI